MAGSKRIRPSVTKIRFRTSSVECSCRHWGAADNCFSVLLLSHVGPGLLTEWGSLGLKRRYKLFGDAAGAYLASAELLLVQK